MAYKLDIRNIVKHHFRTIVNDNTKKPDGRDWCVFLLIPIGIVATLLYFDVLLDKSYISSIISGFAIYVGLALNLIILLYEITQKEGTSDFKKEFAKDLIANICFSILLSILTIISSLFTLIGNCENVKPTLIRYITSGVTYFLIIEMILIIVLLVRSMYFQMIEQINSNTQ